MRTIVIGGRATQFYGVPREAEDLDVLVCTSAPRANLVRALRELGCDVSHPAAAFAEPNKQVAIKHHEFNVDLLTSIDGLEFEHLWTGSVVVTLPELTVRVISRFDLIHSKQRAGRSRDFDDLRALGVSANKTTGA